MTPFVLSVSNRLAAWRRSVNEVGVSKHWASLAIAALFALFSPLLSFYWCVFFLLACSPHLDRKTVTGIGYICAYSGSILIASRKTFEPSDDFSHYYDAYLYIFSEGWRVIGERYGTEIGLPIYYWFLSWGGGTSQVFLLFAVTMLSSSLLVLWLDKYGSLRFPVQYFGTVMAISMLFYGFLQASIMTRQMVSLSIILFAVSTAGWRSFAWLFCAVLFHQSSILVFLLLKYAKRLDWFWITVVLSISITFVLFFDRVAEWAVASQIDFIRVASKLTYYTSNGESFTDADLSGLKVVLICCAAALLSARHMPEGWGRMILLVALLYIMFLPYALVSLRTFLFFVSVIAGYIVAFTAFRVGWTAISWGGAAYGIYILVKQIRLPEDYPFLLWDKFQWFGPYPLYYFFN